jgi:hypothetical protein
MTDSRFQFEADVTDPLGRTAKLRIGAEQGKVITSTPPGEGFSMSTSQCRDAIEAYKQACDAAQAQEFVIRNMRGRS